MSGQNLLVRIGLHRRRLELGMLFVPADQRLHLVTNEGEAITNRKGSFRMLDQGTQFAMNSTVAVDEV